MSTKRTREAELEKGMKVYINSSNDLLQAYWKAKTVFVVDTISKTDDLCFVTLLFGDDLTKFKTVVMGYELIPVNKLLA